MQREQHYHLPSRGSPLRRRDSNLWIQLVLSGYRQLERVSKEFAPPLQNPYATTSWSSMVLLLPSTTSNYRTLSKRWLDISHVSTLRRWLYIQRLNMFQFVQRNPNTTRTEQNQESENWYSSSVLTLPISHNCWSWSATNRSGSATGNLKI